MKTCGGVEIWLHEFLILTVNFTALLPSWHESRGLCVDSTADVEIVATTKAVLAGNEPRTLYLPSGSLVAILMQ
jgi:hypothetical protein